MKRRTDYVSHFAAIEVCGDPSEAGSGLLLLPGKGSQPASIVSVSDDSTPTTKFVATTGFGKGIADGVATGLFEVAVPSAEAVGGSCSFLVRAADGTDLQALAGWLTYAAVNKAGGVVTGTVTYVVANQALAVSIASTLTLAFTVLVGVNKMTIRVQPTGSLVETVFTCEFTVMPIRGAITVL
jgi:hypothetical protein